MEPFLYSAWTHTDSYLRAIRTMSVWINFMKAILLDLCTASTDFKGHAVAQLVEALRYKPEDPGSIPNGVIANFSLA